MAICDGPGSFREAAFSLKLSALIDGVFSGLLDTVAGTGGRALRRFNSTNLMSQNNEPQVLTIDSPEGWVFAFEGGAHILFRHTPTLDRRFRGKLLRLAKRNKHTLPTLKKHQAVLDTFLPLLTPCNGEELVVHTELVKIAPGVLEVLQTEQVCSNTKRQSILNLEETHGTLLEDLTADPTMLLLDFKPKWLSQSPTAPANANTCRTCALRRLRRKQPKSHPRFCPLDLSSGQRDRVHCAVTAILQERSLDNPVLSAQITEHLLNSSLIPTLLKAQTSPNSSLATKMTLRDCTLFVQIPKELFMDPSTEQASNLGETTPTTIPPSPQRPNHAIKPTHKSGKPTRCIRIVIADLDEKSEEIRGAYWKSLESELITGGYYLGNGKLDSNVKDCDLNDVVWTSDQVKWNGHAF